MWFVVVVVFVVVIVSFCKSVCFLCALLDHVV